MTDGVGSVVVFNILLMSALLSLFHSFIIPHSLCLGLSLSLFLSVSLSLSLPPSPSPSLSVSVSLSLALSLSPYVSLAI